MSPKWTTRRATRADRAALLAMMRIFNRVERVPFHRAPVERALGRLLADARLGVVLVAERGAARPPGGYAIATFGYDLEFGGPDAFVTELFVRPRHRGAGLGALLLDGLCAALRAGGAGAVHLLVWPENVVARRLYARAGFVEIPRIVMSRRLRQGPAARPGRT